MSDAKLISVHLDGCHDTTMFEMRVTSEGLALLLEVAKLSVDNGGSCQPTMTVITTKDN